LDLLDRDKGKVVRHISLTSLAHDCLFYQDRRGVLWIYFDSGSGLAAFDQNTDTITRYSFYDAASGRPLISGVTSMLEDEDGVLWLSTNSAGLLRLDVDRQRVIAYHNNPGNPDSLGDNHLTTLCEDAEGNIWVGLHQTAPTVFSRRHRPFETLRSQSTASDRFVGRLVTTFYQDSPGTLWLGLTGAFDRIDLKSAAHKSSPSIGPPIKKDVLSIVRDRTGVLWVGTAGDGLGRFEKGTGRFRLYQHDPDDPRSLSNNIVSRLLVDHTGALWATTWDGLDRFDPESDSFQVYRPEGQGKSATVYGSIMEGTDGILWVSGLSGLHRFDPVTGKFTIFQHDPDNPQSISSNRVVSTYIDRSGALWVASKNGLNRFDTARNRFYTYYERDGLAGNSIECMLEDETGNLWMSSNKGITKFDAARKTFTNYSTADGLPGEDLTGWGTCLKSSSGEMFFGGFSGATTFRPEEIAAESYAPPWF
jgi:ligand-binding sensor domain-containing protein